MKSLIEYINESFRWEHQTYRWHADNKQKEFDVIASNDGKVKRFVKNFLDQEEEDGRDISKVDKKMIIDAFKRLADKHVWASLTDFQITDDYSVAGNWSGKTHIYDPKSEEWVEE